MKFKQLFAAMLLLIICGSNLLVSCKKTDECKSCKTAPADFIKLVHININGHAQSLADIQVWRKNSNAPFEFADERLTDEVYSSIEDGVKSLTGSNQDAILIVLYLNKRISEINEITPASIKAISRFNPDDNMLQHELFIQADGLFIKDKYLSVHSNCVSMGAIYEINDNIVKSENSSIVIIDRKKGNKYKIKNNVDILRKIAVNYTAIKDYFEYQTREQGQSPSEAAVYQYATKIQPDAGRCGGDCPVQSNSFCSRDLGTMYPVTYKCYKESGGSGGGGGVCRTQTNRAQLLEANAMNTDSIYTAHNDPLHYNIRDLFNRNDFGKKYISYYYYFSEVYQSNVSLIVALKTARVLYSFNGQLNKLLKPTEYGTTVFLTADMKNMIIALINDYKRIYNDAYNDVFLNDIINDLNTYENKTVNEILTLF